TEVPVIEFMDRMSPTIDAGFSKELTKVLKKKKMVLNGTHKGKSVERKGKEVTVKADDKKGQEIVLKGDYCLVCVGRKPYTGGLGLEAAGVKLDDRGRVGVNDESGRAHV